MSMSAQFWTQVDPNWLLVDSKFILRNNWSFFKVGVWISNNWYNLVHSLLINNHCEDIFVHVLLYFRLVSYIIIYFRNLVSPNCTHCNLRIFFTMKVLDHDRSTHGLFFYYLIVLLFLSGGVNKGILSIFCSSQELEFRIKTATVISQNHKVSNSFFSLLVHFPISVDECSSDV